MGPDRPAGTAKSLMDSIKSLNIKVGNFAIPLLVRKLQIREKEELTKDMKTFMSRCGDFLQAIKEGTTAGSGIAGDKST